MKKLRHLLWPFALLYGLITWLRNRMFDKGILKQTSFDIPVIALGNLSTGGTGKTPHTEFLISHLRKKYHVGMLSRGYGRKSKGFKVVDTKSEASLVGDEPLQVKRKFPETAVAVCEDRETGIPFLLAEYPETQVILLDDAFQHRRVKAGLYILLSRWDNPFTRDYILPVGNLREGRAGYKRADIIILSKSPEGLSLSQQEECKKEIRPLAFQNIFFSHLTASSPLHISGGPVADSWQSIWKEKKLILFSAIAGGSEWGLQYERHFSETVERISFFDHHRFSRHDISLLEKAIKRHGPENCVVLTTEKDAMRIVGLKDFPEMYYFPVRVEFGMSEEGFAGLIDDFVQHTLSGDAT